MKTTIKKWLRVESLWMMMRIMDDDYYYYYILNFSATLGQRTSLPILPPANVWHLCGTTSSTINKTAKIIIVSEQAFPLCLVAPTPAHTTSQINVTLLGCSNKMEKKKRLTSVH